MEIAIISDTHGYMDDRILHHLAGVNHIFHAGDVGNLEVHAQLAQCAPLTCVYGNIDGTAIRAICPQWTLTVLNGVRFLMIHIAGAIGNYNASTRALIHEHRPDVLICGHSHLLKVARDPRFNLLHINSGAAGRHGFHHVRTMLKLTAANGQVANLRVVELGPRSAQAIH